MLNFFVNTFLDNRISRIERHYTRSEQLSEQTLKELLRYGKQTQYGKKHGLPQVYTYEKFSKALPINNYETIKGDIEKMMRGEQNLLCLKIFI